MKTIIAVIGLLFVILAGLSAYLPNDCEVARPGTECGTYREVMYEKCNYLNAYRGYNMSEIYIAWYIESLCNSENLYHGSDLNCSDLESVCTEMMVIE